MFFYPFFVPKPYRVKIRYQLVKSSKEGPLTVWPISLCPVHQGHLVLNWMHLTKPHFVTPLNEHGSIRKVEVKHYQLWRSLWGYFLPENFQRFRKCAIMACFDESVCHRLLIWLKLNYVRINSANLNYTVGKNGYPLWREEKCASSRRELKKKKTIAICGKLNVLWEFFICNWKAWLWI